MKAKKMLTKKTGEYKAVVSYKDQLGRDLQEKMAALNALLSLATELKA